MRRLLPQIACVWIVCYALGVATPLVVWMSAAPHTDAEECHCTHGAGVMCPMHKTAKGRAGCGLRSGTHHDPLIVVSLLAPIGFSRSMVNTTPDRTHAPGVHDERFPLDRPLTPDSPPPRA